MKIKTLGLATSLAMAAATTGAQAASFPIVDARVAGMGGASVATANLDSAAFYNPALLAAQDSDSDFSLALGAGLGISDPNNMTGAISNFSDSITAFNNLDPLLVATDPTLVQTSFDNLATSVSNFAGKSYNLAVPGNFNLGFAFGDWAASLNGLAFVDASVSVGAADGTPNITDGSGNTITWTDIQSNPTLLASVTTDAQLQFNGVQGTQIGVSLARKLEVAGLDLAVGLTPKLVSISSATGIAALDSSGAPSLTTSSAVSDFNLDAGVVWNMSQQIRVAGSIRNIIGKSYGTGAGAYELKPQMRAGIGYTTSLFSVGADLDVTENDSFGAKSRVLAIGSEFNAWNIIQMRVGYRNDLSSSLTQYSLGAGLFNSALNFAVMMNPDNVSQGVSGYIGFGVNF